MRLWQGCCPMPQASLLICLSPRILTCLLFGSVTGEDCPKMTATPLDKNITHPRLFPQIPACPFFSPGILPAHKDPLLHQNTALDGGDSAWRAPPTAVLGHQRRSPPPPKKKVTLLSQGVIRDHRRNLQSGFTKKTGKECAPRQARPDRWHHSGAGAGGRAEELRLCDGCPQVAELHRGTAMHGK